MDVKKVVDFWLEGAKDDLKTVEALWERKRYHHCLFFCHLVLEKVLKALVVEKTREHALPTHDLLLLARKAGLELPPEKLSELGEINDFNVRARYNDFKRKFYKKATREYTEKWYSHSREIYQWLKRRL